ncbi:MAG: hypothetical protein ACREEA_09630 [Stellaceae bacterium]
MGKTALCNRFERELAALIMAIHRTTQLALPVLVAGAGLASLPALAGEAKPCASASNADLVALKRRRSRLPWNMRQGPKAARADDGVRERYRQPRRFAVPHYSYMRNAPSGKHS